MLRQRRAPRWQALHQRLGGLLLALLTGCASTGLERVAMEGSELHASLGPKDLEEAHHGVPEGILRSPQLSSDPRVVESVGSFASQGQLDGEGIRRVLFAVYEGESEVGLYGLEAASPGIADGLETRLRAIWAHNVSLERTRIHRGGAVLLVVWHDGVTPGCWEAVNARLVARLESR